MVSSAAFWTGFALLVLLTAAGLRVYLPLARTVLVERRGLVNTRWVHAIDALLAIGLAAWFLMLGRDAMLDGDRTVVGFRAVVTGAFVYAAVVVFLLGILLLRNESPSRVFGFESCDFTTALWRALVCLIAAYPLLMLVQAMVYGITDGNMAPQDVVEVLQKAEAPRDRIAVMVMALAVAPVAEEIIFRGFLYPAAKRYIGPFAALVITSFLFAVLHGHVPSVPALAMLAVCLTLAYEKTGSLIVPMAMHALFNAVSVTAILFFT